MAAYIEWLNQNAYRHYPLKEDTPLEDTGDADVTIPDYLLVDFVCTFAGEPDIAVYLAQVSQVGGFLSLVFTDGTNTIATLAVDTTVHEPNDGYSITGQGDYEDARGRVVLGNLANLRDDLPDGLYTFAAELEPGVVRPDIRTVRSLRVGGNEVYSDYIRGHVKLIEGANIQFTYLPALNAIRVDALDTGGFNEECECEDELEIPCIKRINGINVEDVQIIGDGKCLEVKVSGNVIQLTDTCSEPCCGCPELEWLTQHLELLQSTLKRLEDLSTHLISRYQEFIAAILASS